MKAWGVIRWACGFQVMNKTLFIKIKERAFSSPVRFVSSPMFGNQILE